MPGKKRRGKYLMKRTNVIGVAIPTFGIHKMSRTLITNIYINPETPQT